jgi:hypothetical protein
MSICRLLATAMLRVAALPLQVDLQQQNQWFEERRRKVDDTNKAKLGEDLNYLELVLILIIGDPKSPELIAFI